MADEKDLKIGQRIAQLRGERTQQSVADEMRRRGWKWSQATVWSVESGKRPLRFAESSDLASILGVTIWELQRDQPDDSELKDASQEILEPYRIIKESTEQLIRGHANLAHALRDSKLSADVLAVYASILEYRPWHAVQEGLVNELAEESAENIREQYRIPEHSLKKVQEIWELARAANPIGADRGIDTEA